MPRESSIEISIKTEPNKLTHYSHRQTHTQKAKAADMKKLNQYNYLTIKIMSKKNPCKKFFNLFILQIFAFSQSHSNIKLLKNVKFSLKWGCEKEIYNKQKKNTFKILIYNNDAKNMKTKMKNKNANKKNHICVII